MADKRITDLPLILSGDITSNDVLPIVNIDLDITNKVEVDQLKSYILNGVNDYYVTGGTYSGGTLVLDRQDGSVTITGFTTGGTGTSLYEVGSGVDSTQRIGVGNQANGDYSFVGAGSGNTALDNYSTISGGYKNTTNGNYGRNFIGNGQYNTISAYYGCSVIAGGESNTTLDLTTCASNSFIGGGVQNTSSGYYSIVGGGRRNKALGSCSVVMGGCGNVAASRSIVGGGRRNTAGILNGVDTIVLISYTGSSISSGTYFANPTTLTGYGSGLGLSVTFDSFGSITNTIIEGSGQLYSFGNQVLIPGDYFPGGSTPNDDMVFEIQGTFTRSCASIIGGCGNRAIGTYSTVSGGYENTASEYASTISGGYNNTASGQYSFIGGGCLNTSSGQNSFIGGGEQNTSIGNNAVVSGGIKNTSNGFWSTISGGEGNKNFGEHSFIGGGNYNTLTNSKYGSISGGNGNRAQTDNVTIGGGDNNLIGAIGTISSYYVNSFSGYPIPSGTYSLYQNTTSGIGSNATFSVYIDGSSNIGSIGITNKGFNYLNGDTITINGNQFPGGSTPGNDLIISINGTLNLGNFSTIAGGCYNTTISNNSFIGGGYGNTASCDRSTIVGGSLNTTSGLYSSIGGGFRNEALGNSSTISGGYCNTTSLVNLSTISGGYCNTINNSYSFIGGGFRNKALGYSSTIVGGYCNTTDGDSSMILGGCSNTTIGVRSAVIGGQNIVSTENDMVYMPSANIQSIGYLYFGDVNTDGSWRMSISGATFIIEKLVGGSWVTSGTFV